MNTDNNSDFNNVSEQTGQKIAESEEHVSLNDAINRQINSQFSGPIEKINIHQDTIENIQPNSFENTAEIISRNNSSYNVEKDSKKKFLTDDEMLYAFVKKNYDKFVTRSFNFAAFFFNVVYLLYRKMYGYAFIVTAITVLLSIFINNIIYVSIGTLVISFLLGLFINKLYLNHCRNKIDGIRYKYAYADNNTLLEVCRKKGGTSILSIILGFIFNAVVIVVVFIAYLMLFLKLPITDAFNKIVGNSFDFSKMSINIGGFSFSFSSSKSTKKYNGNIEIDNLIWIKEEFQINIPAKFQEASDNSNSYLSYSYKSDTTDCSFTLTTASDYTSAEELIKEIAEYYSSSNPQVGQILVNDKTWQKISIKNSFGNKYMYAGTKNNKVYLFTYNISLDNDGYCSVYHDIVVNSIKEK